MDVVSVCPLQVASLHWMPREGAHAFTVVAKATFELTSGKAPLAQVQDYPNEYDNHWNDDDACSVYSPCDLAPFKPRADVMLVGDAYAPGGNPTRTLVTRLMVGTLEKAIEVTSDRFFDSRDELGEGEPFTRMALRYERAAGGMHTTNPVGIDLEGERDRYGRLVIPNLVKPGTIPDRHGVIEPVGFGPIAATWSTRRVLLGRHAHDWSDSRWFDVPMPTDIDGAYFQSAPLDQRLDELRENDRITLENLHPDHPRLVCHLPGFKPVGFVDAGGAVRELSMRADTLWIDTTRNVFTVTWRGRVDLGHPSEPGCVYVTLAEPGEKVTWAEVKQLATVASISDDQTSDGIPGTSKPELPFAASISDEQTAIGIPIALRSPKVPPWLNEQQLTTQRQPARSMQQILHKDDQSPAWLRDATRAADGAQPGPDPLNSTVGYGMVSPWAGSNGPIQPGARKQPPPPAPPPPPGASAPPLETSRAPAAPPPPAPPAPAPAVPVAGPPLHPMIAEPHAVGAPINVRPPNPVEALQQRARADQSYDDVSPLPIHDRLARQPVAEIIEVLWYDAERMDKVRAKAEWRELFDFSDEREEDDDAPFEFDEEPPAEEDPVVRNRRHIVAVMTRGHITTGASLPHAMGEAVDATGNFEPPLVIMTGRLHFPFDDLKTLRATLAAVTPLIAGNKELGDTVAAVNELMQTPWLEEGSGDVARKLTDRVRDAFKRGDRLMDPNYLDDHTERILLEQRCYSMRSVFGADYIRALLAPSSQKTRIPVYIPASLQKDLPMFKSIPARILAEAHMSQDQYEAHDCALKVTALGRVVQLTRGAY